MKLERFYDDAIGIVDYFLDSLDQPIRSPAPGKPKLVCISSAEKIHYLLEVFSQIPSAEHHDNYTVNIGHYLNRLIQYVAAQNQSDHTNDVSDTNLQRDFFFLAVDPLTLVHNPECQNHFISKYLRLIKTQLELRKEKLLLGWRVEESEKGPTVCNIAHEDDWREFLTCVENSLPTLGTKTLTLERLPDAQTQGDAICRLSETEYRLIRREQNIQIPFEKEFLATAKELLSETVPGEDPTLKKVKAILLSVLNTQSTMELSKVFSKTVERNLQQSQNGSREFYQKLSGLSNSFQAAKRLQTDAEIPQPLPKEKMTASNEEPAPAIKKTTLEDLRAEFPDEVMRDLVDIEQELHLCLKTACTLPRIPEPYDPKAERVVTETVLEIDDILLKLKSVTAFLKMEVKDSKRVTLLRQWLISNLLPELNKLISLFGARQYSQTIISLSTSFITFIEAIRSQCDPAQFTDLNNAIYSVTDDLLTAHLSSGYYETLLHWMRYFQNVLCSITKKDTYHYHLRHAADNNYYALVAQHLGELRVARYYLDKASECVQYAIKAFVKKIDPNAIKSFLAAVGAVSDSYYRCYRALGAEEFSSGQFLDASNTFTRCEDSARASLYKSAILAINKAQRSVEATYTLKEETQSERGLTDDKNINSQWCALSIFLSIKRWLSTHLPKEIKLSEHQGTLTLTFSKSKRLKSFTAHLSAHKVSFKSESEKVILDDFNTLDLEVFSTFFDKAKEQPVIVSNRRIDTASATLSINPNANVDCVSVEVLQYRRLRAMHYRFLHHHNEGALALLDKNLRLFIDACRDPLLKSKAEALIISSNLLQSLFSLTLAGGQEHERFFSAARAQVAAIVETKEACVRLQDYQEILCSYLRTRNLVSLSENLEPLRRCEETHQIYFYSFLLGTEKTLSTYESLSAKRDECLSRSLCFDRASYKTRDQLLLKATEISFELAFELWTQGSLLEMEGNNEEIAAQRVYGEYLKLRSLPKPSKFDYSAIIEAYILVVRARLEVNVDLDASLKLFDQAFKILKKSKKTAYACIIIFQKIHFILGTALADPFLKLKPDLNVFLEYVKESMHSEAKMNSYIDYFIAHQISELMLQHLTLSQEHILRFRLAEDFTQLQKHGLQYQLSSVYNSLLQQRAIIAFFQRKIAADKIASAMKNTAELNIKAAKTLVEHSIKVIDTIILEDKIYEELAQRDAFPEPQPLSFEVLLAQDCLTDDEHLLVSPTSPLACLVFGCKKMFDYTGDEELTSGYRLIAEKTQHWLECFLPPELSAALLGDNENGSFFEPLLILMSCLTSAHCSTHSPIAEHIPLIRRLVALYPDNPYLHFTLFDALSRSTPVETPCAEAVEACRKAAEAGYCNAEYRYARLLERGDYGAEMNAELAEVYFQRSAGQNYYKAQLHIARTEKFGFFGKIYAKAAMNNPETPYASRLEIVEDFGLVFIPFQHF